jgi:hypothetical protein
MASVVRGGVEAAENAGLNGVHTAAEGRRYFTVIQLPHDARLVDVAVQEFHKHFAADAWKEGAAPVGACDPLAYRHPSARGVVAGGVAGLLATRIGKPPSIGTRPALPAKLDAHLMVAVGAKCAFR